MNKKGFTLIEMIIVMAIVSLMIGAIGSILISYSKTYKNSVLQNRSFNYLNEAMSIIEREINQDVEQVEINDNIIKINYFETDDKAISKKIFKSNKVNYIKRINSNIYILYGSIYSEPQDNSPGNVIIDEIKDFIAARQNNMIYIKIEWNNGDTIERCLGIENAN